MLWTWEIAQKWKVPKWLGEGAKVFLTLLGPGSKGLPRVFCTTQTLFCTGATPFRTSARGLLLAALLTTFGNFHFSGNFPGLQLPNASRGICGSKEAKTLVRTVPNKTCMHHPFQNIYTHEITIFELFRGLQLQLSGVFRMN